VFECFDLLRGERIFLVGGRHDVFRIMRHDASQEFAAIRFAGNDRRLFRFSTGERAFTEIETQVGFPRFFVLAMTGETVVGEDRPDVAIEGNLRLRETPAGKKEEQKISAAEH
jgi:hypothetical protein